MRNPPPEDAELIRAIGVRRLTAIIINVTVGAGIFVLPATAAAGLGRAAPVAYVVCAVAMALVVACIAAVGSRTSVTGGVYAYTELAFGPFVGFLAGVLYWLSSVFAAASVASALLGSAAVVWPALDQGPTRAALIALAFGGLAWANVRGVDVGGRLVETLTVAKLLPLAVLVTVGLWLAPVDAAGVFPVPDPSAIGRTALLLIFAFVGIEVGLVPGGEIRHPSRTVPRAVLLALLFTTVLYLLLQLVAQRTLGDEMATFADAPLAEAAARLLGPAGRTLVLLGSGVSMLGYLSGDMLGTPRLLFAFGRDGALPRRLAAVHPRFRTPWSAIVTHAALATVLAITRGFSELLIIANVAVLLMYLFCIASAYVLQRRDVRADGAPLMLPAGPLVPIAASVVVIWLLSQATARELTVTATVVAAATVYWVLARGMSDSRFKI
jgi:amino acid transporter